MERPDRHDAYFRDVFADPEAAFELASLSFDSLGHVLAVGRLGKFHVPTDKGDRERFAKVRFDLLFEAEVAGESALVYVLFEHKSSAKRTTLLQMLGYMQEIWRLEERVYKTWPLRPIYPVVVYHGKTPWNAPRLFRTFIPTLSK